MNIRRGVILTMFFVALYFLLPSALQAWTGYDYDTEDYIEIDEDVSAIQGKDIEIYDYSDESYHEAYVISVSSNGTEIEVYDHDNGVYRTFEAEADYGSNKTESQ
jgi:hypothetical protein